MSNAVKLAFWRVIAEEDVRSALLKSLSVRAFASRPPFVAPDFDMHAKPFELGAFIALSSFVDLSGQFCRKSAI